MFSRSAGPFALAVLSSAALVLSGPFVLEIRNYISDTFPDSFVTIVGAAIAVAASAAILWAVVLIRDRRPQRYALIAAAVVLAVSYSLTSSLGDPGTDVVERFHFIEYGLITVLFYRAWRPLGDSGVVVLPMLAGLVVGTCDEWFQWFVPARVGEMRDVFLNGAAIVSGLLFSLALDPPVGSLLSIRRRSMTQTASLAVVATILFAALLVSAHIGNEIVEPEVGAFKSTYTTEELEALSRDRVARWAIQPPVEPPARISLEDHYMSEGFWHVMARNQAWAAGDITEAWYENRILEKHFRPVLETPSYRAANGNAWSPAQRVDAEQRANIPSGASTFVSGAPDQFPIFTWPRRTFLLSIAAVVIGIVAVYVLFVRALNRRARTGTSLEYAGRI